MTSMKWYYNCNFFLFYDVYAHTHECVYVFIFTHIHVYITSKTTCNTCSFCFKLMFNRGC